MNREVLITLRAQQEAQSIHDWWARHRSPEQAARWYEAFWNGVLSLETQSDRCATAAENGRFPYELRQLNFGLGRRPTHRMVFTVRHERVIILRIRHLAQQDIGS